jgi:hypothetical protein
MVRPHEINQGGSSRHTLLKRGAVAGGATAWVVPVISVVSMRPAYAESPSGRGPVPPLVSGPATATVTITSNG